MPFLIPVATGLAGAVGSAAASGLGALGTAAGAGGLGTLGTVIGGVGTVLGGIASRQQAQFQSAVARSNAIAAQQQAAAEEVRFRRERARRMGATRAAFGAAGVSMEGTPLDILAEQALIAEEDALLIRFGGQQRAREQRLQAQLFEQEGQGALVGGILKGGSTILTSGLFQPSVAPSGAAPSPFVMANTAGPWTPPFMASLGNPFAASR